MTEYGFSLVGADSTHKGGATNNGGRSAPSEGTNYGGSGAPPAVQGPGSPVIVATGAMNNGKDSLPRVRKTQV